MARDRTDPGGVTARAHRWPPSVVSHNPSPNTNPCSGVAKRMPRTAPACDDASSGETHVPDVAANPVGTGPAGVPAIGPASDSGDEIEAERPGWTADGPA